MDNQTPLVSLGIPVYNEEQHLEETLHSVVNQKYQNLEIILSDNASTDSTPSICKKFASADCRIKYSQSQLRIDQSENFNQVMKLAQGEYFAWVGGHDILEPDYVEICLKQMMQDSSIALCYSDMPFIDNQGNPLSIPPTRLDMRNINEPTLRFIAVTLLMNRGEPIHALIRSQLLKQISLTKHSLFPDMIFLSELALKGKLAYIPLPLLRIRAIRNLQTFSERLEQCEKTMFAQSNPSALRFPYWRLWRDYFRVIFRASLDLKRKLFLLFYLLFFFSFRYKSNLFQDLKRKK